MNNLGLDRDAAAMLMIESDMPGAAAVDELERAEAACRVAGATDVVRAADAQEADWLRQARRAAHYALERLGEVRMEDVGVPAVAGRRHAPRDRADRGASTASGSGRSAMPATATCTRTSSSTAAIPQAEAKTEAVKTDLYRAALDLGGTVTGRARHRRRAARVAGDPARPRRGPRHARDQGRARPARHPQPGAGRLALAAPAPRRWRAIAPGVPGDPIHPKVLVGRIRGRTVFGESRRRRRFAHRLAPHHDAGRRHPEIQKGSTMRVP